MLITAFYLTILGDSGGQENESESVATQESKHRRRANCVTISTVNWRRRGCHSREARLREQATVRAGVTAFIRLSSILYTVRDVSQRSPRDRTPEVSQRRS